jgi:subtilisin-like proprotein convertase family protein
MNAKSHLFAGLATMLALQLCPKAAGQITTTASVSPDAVIQDDNVNGLSSSITLNSAINSITSVQVTVDVVGSPYAFNGDYYAYLQYSSGLVVLLNNLGGSIGNPYGSPGDGFNVTFSDSAPNISTAPEVPLQALTGTYAPQEGSLSTFDGLNPDGTWTLFIADEQPGGVGELKSWSLDVTGNPLTVPGVPDNSSTLELLVLGASSLALLSLRQRRLVK